MTTTTSAPESAAGSVPAVPPPVLQRPRRRRRRGLIALAALAIALGGVVGWWAVQRSTERVAVVGVARDVAWGQVITAGDLQPVELAPDPGITPVPWADRDVLIGHRAASDLAAGSVITGRAAAAAPFPGPGKALVGVSVRTPQAPVTPLLPRQTVWLVPGAGQQQAAGAGRPATIPGVVYTVGPPAQDGSRTVDVVVDAGVAAQLAIDSAAGRVAVVLAPAGGR